MNTYLKAKVNAIAISGCKVDYEGSLTLDEDMMDQLRVSAGEQVHVNGKYKPSRIITYVIPGERGSLKCEMNGGAAQYFQPGDMVHLLFWTLSEKPVKPIII